MGCTLSDALAAQTTCLDRRGPRLARRHAPRSGRSWFAAGALPVDFELAEVPFDDIVPRFKHAPRAVAALRGEAPEPLGRDRAVRRLTDEPVAVVVAAQSEAACRRAARLGCGVLYDSLQSPEVSARLGAAHRDGGWVDGRILIRRVWIGDPPTAGDGGADGALSQLRQRRSDQELERRLSRPWGDCRPRRPTLSCEVLEHRIATRSTCESM